MKLKKYRTPLYKGLGFIYYPKGKHLIVEKNKKNRTIIENAMAPFAMVCTAPRWDKKENDWRYWIFLAWAKHEYWTYLYGTKIPYLNKHPAGCGWYTSVLERDIKPAPHVNMENGGYWHDEKRITRIKPCISKYKLPKRFKYKKY